MLARRKPSKCTKGTNFFFENVGFLGLTQSPTVVQIRAAFVPASNPDKRGGLRQEGHPA